MEDRIYQFKKGEQMGFACPLCKERIAYTDGDAVCVCGHLLTDEERNQIWTFVQIN